MARLYEHQGKALLKGAGLLVPEGEVAATPEEAYAVAERIGRPVAVKAQVWSTGRFKAGGIRFAATPDEARDVAAELIGKDIKGFRVEKVLVEERLGLEQEFYAGVIVDASHKVRAPVVMFSTEGGVDVESAASGSVARMTVDFSRGVELDDALGMVRSLSVPEALAGPLARAVVALYGVFRESDARSAEINPLVLTKDGRVMAADCRVSVDDSSVSRHPELGIRVARESDTPPTQWDLAAWKVEEADYRGSSYFAQMASGTAGGGYIGYHAIGGGGALLAADMLAKHGLELANFAETSGNPPAAKVYRIAKLVLSQPRIEGYCMMGAVIASQDQWYHALGLVKALREMLADRPGFPVVILIAGNREVEALEILREGLAGLPVRSELFGREHLHKLDRVAARMKELVEEYREGAPVEKAEAAAAPDVESDGFTQEHVFRTGRVLVDERKCEGCTSLACVKACSLYGGYLYRVREGRMALGIPPDDVPRRCNECLACEYECRMRGQGALRIELPLEVPES
ncbi:MAG: ATP-grasp domain-containing protein [Planctomycetota bacterium]|jgi:succinyl-CoA synthetase beta subunit